MIRRLITLSTVGVLVWLLMQMSAQDEAMSAAEGAFMLGFALLAAGLLGEIVEHAKLPRITGYILAGVLFGPWAAGFLAPRVLEPLGIFNDMAYAFIGLAAGAELKLSGLKQRAKSIVFLILLTTTVVMLGVGGTFFLVASFSGPFRDLLPIQALAVAGLVGIIAAARSPASAIAIISETKAKGPFSETILGVSVAMDVVVICLFSVGIALCGLAFAPEEGLDLLFVLGLGAEILTSVVLGVILGVGMSLYLKRRGPQVPLVIIGLCFMVYRCSEILDHYIEQVHHFNLALEPLLICVAAGFVIQNLSHQGSRLATEMDRVALPVYVLFFTMAGAKLDLGALQGSWAVALGVVACRLVMINIGTRLATTLAGDPPQFRRYCWMGFVTQAGLSLALIAQLEDGYGDWGPQLATILVAVVAVNQLVGPAAFKIALEKTGEVTRGSTRISTQKRSAE